MVDDFAFTVTVFNCVDAGSIKLAVFFAGIACGSAGRCR
jgi:hypothetical protein